MPKYAFELRDGDRGIMDAMGVDLPDRAGARRYAFEVARELMRGREVETRCWRLDIFEGEERIDQVVFASADQTLDHLTPEHRAMMQVLCDRKLSLIEAGNAVRTTLRESRALVARSRGRPYLATYRGDKIIRDD